MEKQNISKGFKWASYILQGLVSLMFLMGAANNLLKTEMAVSGAKEMGYPEGAVFYLGIILLLATLLYLVPKTTMLGAAFLTAWLGGAVATHIIHGDSSSLTLFPVAMGVLVWLAIWLRNSQLKNIFPIT